MESEYGWALLSSCVAPGGAPVRRFQAPSGARLTLMQVEGPLVAAYVALATEAHDDDGLPHTLEHLVFLGSEDYPFKGLLDLFANRCFASGTNAWTDVDHTAYTLKTAGSTGMLKMLPVYMDHILFPLLTDQGYTTEVHHVNNEGKDAGVVYSEMQGRENTAESRCYRKLLLAAYPDSGYSSETGGLMENLRTSTDNTKVRNYHKNFYRPENILITIVGQIDHMDIIKALSPIERKIMNKRARESVPPFVRPWQSKVPPVKIRETIQEKYPTDSEDSGLIMVGWRGPNILEPKGFYNFTACCILLRYLCDTPIAPLQKALVEIENPYASDVSIGIIENAVPLFVVTLENVPLNQLEKALPELNNTIKLIQATPGSIDIDRIKTILEKQIQENLSAIENNPHDAFAFSSISDVLYSLSDKQFEEILNKPLLYKKLLLEDNIYWEKLFNTYFDDKYVSVVGSPSTELMMQLFEEENQRCMDNQQTLGVDGLAEKLNTLKNAIEYNEREPPPVVFSEFGHFDCDDIKYFTLDSWATGESDCPYFDLKELPTYSRVHHINSQFTYITLLMNTSSLTSEERCYLPLVLELLPQSSYTCEGVEKDHTLLVEEIEKLTNSLDFKIGVGKSSGRFGTSQFHETALMSIQCEPDKYNHVVKLIWCILKNTIFTKTRTLIVAQKMVNDIARIRREGDRIVTDLLRNMFVSKESNVYNCSILRQQRFLNCIISNLEKQDEYNKILDNLENIRQKLLAKNNIWLHFAANLKKTTYSTDPWKTYPVHIPESDVDCDSIIPGVIVQDDTLLIEKHKIEGQGCIVGIGGLESCFIKQYSPGPLYHSHADIPALLVALKYFTQLEGPMWRQIRGAGLSYDYSLSLKPNEGFIEFHIFKATDAVGAYEKAKSIIESFLSEKKWDNNLYTSAKSSLVFDLVNQESSPAKLIKSSLLNYYKRVDQAYNTELVQKVLNVNKDDMTRVAEIWLPKIFNPTTAIPAIVCNPSKTEEMRSAFKKFGFDDLNVSKTIEESHLNDE